MAPNHLPHREPLAIFVPTGWRGGHLVAASIQEDALVIVAAGGGL
jgi:hypothetical protein